MERFSAEMQKIWRVAGQLRHFDGSNVLVKKKEGISVKDYADVPRVLSPGYTSFREDVPRVWMYLYELNVTG